MRAIHWLDNILFPFLSLVLLVVLLFLGFHDFLPFLLHFLLRDCERIASVFAFEFSFLYLSLRDCMCFENENALFVDISCSGRLCI